MRRSKKFVPEPDESVFRDREKEAKFWEENVDKVWRKPIKVKFAKNAFRLSDSINMRLDPRTSYVVRQEAKKKGLGPTQLIRMWVMEKLAQMKLHPAA